MIREGRETKQEAVRGSGQWKQLFIRNGVLHLTVLRSPHRQLKYPSVPNVTSELTAREKEEEKEKEAKIN